MSDSPDVMTAEAEPAPPIVRPLARHPQLETDAFCEGCGYNLHGQMVTRDERLGIPVCRCPECGRFHAAGRATSAAYPWLSRFALVLVGLWVTLSIWLLTLAAMGTGTVQYAYLDTFTRGVLQTPDGREVDGGFVNGPVHVGGPRTYVVRGTNETVTDVVFRRQVRPWPVPVEDAEGGGRYTQGPGWPELLEMYATLAAIGLATAVFLVIAMWHWKKSRYYRVMLAPFVVAAVTFAFWSRVPGVDNVYGWSIGNLLSMAATQALAAWIGVRIGRPLARLVVGIIVPPGPRQLLAFLWRADGHPAPAV